MSAISSYYHSAATKFNEATLKAHSAATKFNEATLKARNFAKDKWNGTDIYELTGKQDAVYKGEFIWAIKQAAGPNATIMKSKHFVYMEQQAICRTTPGSTLSLFCTARHAHYCECIRINDISTFSCNNCPLTL